MQQELLIREISTEDYKCIYELSVQLGYDYPIEKIKDRIIYILNNSKAKIFVGTVGDRVVGYIHLDPYELLYEDSLINILGFIVNEDFRGCGIGSKLIEKAELWAKENRFTGIRLVSGFDRVNAHRFYENNGYFNRKNQKNFIKIFK